MQGSVVVILVVEDDFLIQDMVQGALSEGGFESEVTSSGEEAVTLLLGDQNNYRALVTDIHLQGALTGWDVAKRARELNPDLPVIYMSGAGPINGLRTVCRAACSCRSLSHRRSS